MDETKKTLTKNWPVTILAFSLGLSALIASTSYHYSAFHSSDIAVPTITVDGKGEATRAPDIAMVTFSLTEVSPSVKEAQQKVETLMTKVTGSLKDLGVASKDIKTESYSVNPKYSYPQVVCMGVVCPSSSPKLEGYEVNEYVSVKVRNINSAGDVIGLLGKNEVEGISGPNFGIENSDDLIVEARSEAVKKAMTKAQDTAKSLGKTLGDIRVYSENNGGDYAVPMMYEKTDSFASGSSPRVTLAQGETKITVNVSLTYSLK